METEKQRKTKTESKRTNFVLWKKWFGVSIQVDGALEKLEGREESNAITLKNRKIERKLFKWNYDKLY